MRLDKFLVEMNIGSRSQVKELIKKKMILVNDELALRPEFHIDPNKDRVSYQSMILTYEKYSYYMLNKPAGVVSATYDNMCSTVVDLLRQENKKDLFPIGRLDKDTEGLLIITNDGDLAHRLLSPKKHVPKSYLAIIDGSLSQEDIDTLENGMDIGEEKVTLPARVVVESTSSQESTVSITITEGKFHQVKRMFLGVNRKVIYLKRTAMGGLLLDTELPLGSYRPLSENELLLLQDIYK